jgi:hypothetical protein
MFADLCLAIDVQNFLLEYDESNRNRAYTSAVFSTSSRGTRYILKLHVFRDGWNNNARAYYTCMSTERNDFGLFEVNWIRWQENATGTSVYRSTHYVHRIQDFYDLFDRYGPPTRSRAS